MTVKHLISLLSEREKLTLLTTATSLSQLKRTHSAWPKTNLSFAGWVLDLGCTLFKTFIIKQNLQQQQKSAYSCSSIISFF